MKNKFIENEIWVLAWGATSQRANIFVSNIEQMVKEKWKKDLKKYVFNLLNKNYKLKNISEKDHIENIINVKIENKQDGINFKIGHAQKLLNLLLKYYWCLGWIKNEPPHCPVDRIILTEGKVKNQDKDIPAWTKIDSIDEYKDYIKQLKSHVKNTESTYNSLSEWELAVFNRR